MRTSVLLRWGLVVPVVVVALLVGYVHVLGPRAVAMEPGLTPLLTPLNLATWVGAALVGVAVALGWTWLGLHTGARASARGVRLLGWWWVSAAVVGVYLAACTTGMGTVLAHRGLGMPGVWLAALIAEVVLLVILVVLGQQHRDARTELAYHRRMEQSARA